jgi:8-oxo-dGTP pyrophosphatase MutT (NUDIX family)
VTDGSVRAAGGVVIRRDEEGERGNARVLLVHRPRYDDWSFPKGKLYDGESETQGAVREVREETGYVCRTGDEVGRVRYADRGRDKQVVYFAMRCDSRVDFVPNDEVDEVRWVDADEARTLLTWPRDVPILERALER